MEDEIKTAQTRENFAELVAGMEYPVGITMEFKCASQGCDSEAKLQNVADQPVFLLPDPRCLCHPSNKMHMINFSVAPVEENRIIPAPGAIQ